MPRKEKVTGVIDGDTFRTNFRIRPERLANVDAPEKKQPYGKKAKKDLQKLISGKTVTIKSVARDKWGRTVAYVSVNGRSVNRAMTLKIKKYS